MTGFSSCPKKLRTLISKYIKRFEFLLLFARLFISFISPPHSARMKLETEKTEKETQLEHNLFRKREELESRLAEVSEQDLAERLQEAQEELKEVRFFYLKDFSSRNFDYSVTVFF